MSNIRKRIQSQEKKETISMLRTLIEKLQNGEFQLVGKGSWHGGNEQNITFRVIVKESEDSSRNPKF